MTSTTHDRPVPTDQDTTPTIEQQAAEVVMPLAAGYVGHRTIAIGLRSGCSPRWPSIPTG